MPSQGLGFSIVGPLRTVILLVPKALHFLFYSVLGGAKRFAVKVVDWIRISFGSISGERANMLEVYFGEYFGQRSGELTLTSFYQVNVFAGTVIAVSFAYGVLCLILDMFSKFFDGWSKKLPSRESKADKVSQSKSK